MMCVCRDSAGCCVPVHLLPFSFLVVQVLGLRGASGVVCVSDALAVDMSNL